MTLKEQITENLVNAMKAKDELNVSVLRLLKAAIMKFEVSGDKRKDASDEEVMTIINKEVKQRKDSIEAFRKGDREELAKKEEAELKILSVYLPAQMSEAELRPIVEAVIKEMGATSKADFGKVMGQVMIRVKGKADGQAVSKIASDLLK